MENCSVSASKHPRRSGKPRLTRGTCLRERIVNRRVDRDINRLASRVHLGSAEAQHSDRGTEPFELELPIAEDALRKQDDVRACHLRSSKAKDERQVHMSKESLLLSTIRCGLLGFTATSTGKRRPERTTKAVQRQ